MFRKIVGFFDNLEDRARARLSRSPVIYAFIGGIGIVLFWHAITEIAIAIPFMNQWHALPWLIVSLILLITSGIFVSYFVGDQIIMSGLLGEKKIIERTKEEIVSEESQLKDLTEKLARLEKKIDTLLKKP
ncbi:MAG: hypothetical protein NTV48_00120 [Candidatus Vogelbacteria bacterium]|nr:hypothetical protein [Candidatus Vogelbacteria bacterium]